MPFFALTVRSSLSNVNKNKINKYKNMKHGGRL
ncbi:hypothetical protein SAMN05443529_108123 [Desulfosporosinus hippei DSM 8344]|uniref:Uncharacterized protein n=1 Tax=Desulfosporosinus hippei DSM 8344 TaxID=1121419 RepID=A0A1G7YQ06_9FIRM|nr:hypothetical protein SAMN05443529_108123 [Desulfosporosinus hippei DSM 8344]